MKVFFLGLFLCYIAAVTYLYFTQDAKIFNKEAIVFKPPLASYEKHRVSMAIGDEVVLDGIAIEKKKSKTLYLYFGGNADDATLITEYLPNLRDNLVAFNYRGYGNSTGMPSQEALFQDALKIYDKFAQEKEVIAIGRSLGSGVVSYLASQRELKGVILITPYDSISSMAKKRYPYFPIGFLLRHKFESTKYLYDLSTPIGLIEVVDDTVVSPYHFEKLKDSVANLALHVRLKETTHGSVLSHKDFEKTVYKMSEKF